MRKARRLCLYIALLIPTCLLLTETLLYSQNSLFVHPEWTTQKRMMKMLVMGVDEFLITRVPLAQNILNLGSYYGFQEVIYRQPLDLKEVRFDFEVPEESYLDITYNRNSEGYQGLRLSRRGSSFSFTSLLDGRFLKKEDLPELLVSGGWHQGVLKTSDGRSQFILDGKEISLPSEDTLSRGQWGVRAGLAGAKLHSVSFVDKEGAVISTSFRNTKAWWSCFFGNLVILILISFGFSKLSIGSFFSDSKEGLLQCLMFSLVGFIVVGIWFAFDFGFYSSKAPAEPDILEHYAGDPNSRASIEGYRVRFFMNWYKFFGGETVSRSAMADQGYPVIRSWKGWLFCGFKDDECFHDGALQVKLPVKSNSSYRIVFIGSSQTFGIGAKNLEDTFFARTYRFLQKSQGEDVAVEAINMAVSGGNSSELLNNYKKSFEQLDHDVLVINLSSNDNGNPEFEKNISQFVEINLKKGIKTILVKEPESIERVVAEPNKNHQILDSLGRQYGVRVLDLHQYMNKAEMSLTGPIWWDYIHLTGLGHQFAGDFLGPRILEVLKSIRPRVRKNYSFVR